MASQAGESGGVAGATGPDDPPLTAGPCLLRAQSPGGIGKIPPAIVPRFAPARHCLFEWSDYWLECDGADGLRVGDVRLEPLSRGLFRVRFENQLGLTSLQPFRGGRPLFVEVISRKFPSPGRYLDFFSALLNDLFTRAAPIPFEDGGRPALVNLLKTDPMYESLRADPEFRSLI